MTQDSADEIVSARVLDVHPREKVHACGRADDLHLAAYSAAQADINHHACYHYFLHAPPRYIHLHPSLVLIIGYRCHYHDALQVCACSLLHHMVLLPKERCIHS